MENQVSSYIINEDSQFLGNRGDGLTDDPEVSSVCHQTVSLTGSTDKEVYCWLFIWFIRYTSNDVS